MWEALTDAGEPHVLERDEVEVGDCDTAMLRLARDGLQIETNFRYQSRRRSSPEDTPLMRWSSEQSLDSRTAARPPDRVYGPAWVITTEGPGQSPTTFVRAAVVVGVVGSPHEPQMRLYARSLDGTGAPFAVTTPEEVRDYFLTALARARGLAL
jgi:hypothetical protein